MILGTYWFYAFPDDLYTYDYFKFRKGLGGQASTPAELLTTVIYKNPTILINELSQLIVQHEDAFIFIDQKEEHLRIGTGGYYVHDYEFELCKKIEVLFRKLGVSKSNHNDFQKTEVIRLTNPKEKTIPYRQKLFQVVGSDIGKHNAESAALRLDCHIKTENKEAFMNDLLSCSDQLNIHVIFYSEKEIETDTNIMLFLTNGRQGVGLQVKQKVNIQSIEEKMEELMLKHQVHLKHLKGIKNYPLGERIFLKTCDKEFF